MIAAIELARLLADGRFDLSNEKACQADVDLFLAARLPAGCVLRREYRLGPHDVIDFLVGGRIGVEVKMQRAQPRDVARQLARYAAFSVVGDLILLSGKAMRLPPSIGGKPLYGVSLGRAWL